MLPASGIKRRPASWARVSARHVPLNTHLMPASAAEHRGLTPLRPRPNPNRVPRKRLVAILAGVINPAALHFDRDNVELAPVMRAPRLRIQLHSANLWS
jgi:hypothetical protein